MRECRSAKGASGGDGMEFPILNMKLDMRNGQGYVILTDAAPKTDVDHLVSPLKDLLNKASRIHQKQRRIR